MNVVIFHNPRCSKSRQALQLLIDRGIEPEIVKYLERPPDAAELERILGLLDLEPRELMRAKEKEYKDLGLADPGKGRQELIDAMVEYPRLIERPIVVRGDRAVVGRPTEKIIEIL